jgi:hypothetical protein
MSCVPRNQSCVDVLKYGLQWQHQRGDFYIKKKNAQKAHWKCFKMNWFKLSEIKTTVY